MCSDRTARGLASALAIAASAMAAHADAAAPPPPADDRGAVVALEVGLGATLHGDGVFAPGLGKAYLIGYRIGGWSFEYRFGEGYDQVAQNQRLADAGVHGPLAITTGGIRRVLGGARVAPTLFLGGARLARPLLVEAQLARQHGVGLALGGGLRVRFGPRVYGAIDLRAYLARWDVPPGAVSTAPVDDAGGGVTFTPTTTPAAPVPLTMTAGLTLLL